LSEALIHSYGQETELASFISAHSVHITYTYTAGNMSDKFEESDTLYTKKQKNTISKLLLILPI